MAFNLPEAGVSLYMVFFVSRESPVKSVKSLLLMTVITGLALVYSLALASLPGDGAAIRFVGCAVLIFVSMFLSQASTKMGKVWLMTGIFGEVFIQQWDKGLPAEATLELILYVWLALLVGFAVGVTVELAFHSRDPFQNLQDEFSSRLKAIESTLSSFYQEKADSKSRKQLSSQLSNQALKGTAGLQAMLAAAENQRPELKRIHAEVSGAIQLSAVLVDQMTVLASRQNQHLGERDRAVIPILVHQCQALRQAICSANRPANFSEGERQELAGTTFERIGATLAKINRMLSGAGTVLERPASKGKQKALKPDAWSNNQYLINALKVTAAAMLCWVLYKAIDWPQISTSVTTCLITALGARGEEREKQTLRLTGDSVAGLCAIAALIWIIPGLQDIAGLTVVVAGAGFLGAWVYLSSPRLAYAGRQFSYCFYLATLTSSRTPTSLNEARDRVAGVFLGITAMWLIYDQIKPVWTFDQIKSLLVKTLQPIQRVAQIRESEGSVSEKYAQMTGLRDTFTKSFSLLRRSLDVQPYELDVRSEERKEVVPRLSHVCDLLQQSFVSEIVLLEEQLAEVRKDGDDLPSSAEELRSMISQLKGDSQKRLDGATPQQDDSTEHTTIHELAHAIGEVFP